MFAIWSADPMLRIPVEVSPPFSAIGDDDPGQSLLAVEVLKKWETLIRNGVLNLPGCRLNHRFVKKLHEVISKGYRVPEVLPDYISLTNVSNWRSVATGSYAQKLFIRKLGDSTLLVYDTSIAVWGDTVVAKVMPLVRKIWGREDYPMECKLLWREMKIGRERWVVSILKLDKGKWRYDISETVSADDYRWGLKLKWGVLELGAVDLGVEIRKGGST